MLATFTPQARRTIVRAGILAGGAGTLGDALLLMALAEQRDLGRTAAEIGTEIGVLERERRDRAALATLGIDPDEVRRRALEATSLRLDDPALWRLHRSRVRPLRITLTGPATEIVLNAGGRKAIEVARWASRRGHRALIGRDDLLCGLLADGSSESVRVLGRHNVNRLWAELGRHAT